MENAPCTYRLSVKAIVKNGDGKILLIREKDGRWELPGGGLEQGERPTQGLAREVTEELGYTARKVSQAPSAFWTITRKEAFPNGLKWFAFVAYDVEASGNFSPSPHTNDEAHEARYFSPEDAKKLNLHENTEPFFKILD